ncbi:MAG TPA: aminomethyltransferase family protein [Pyrinomonadaceae bacterium]|jgi:folate-binding protein YgfZ
MSEAIEQAVIRKSPLDATHRQSGASLAEQDGWSLPASYGDTLGEYEAVRGATGAGLIDLASRGLVEVSGAEATAFLNGLITNDVKTLEDGAWMLAAFPNAQGRLIAFARVLHLGDSYLFDTERATHAAVFKALERFTLAGDFHVADRTDETALLSVQGARAAACVGSTLGEDAARVERGRIHTVQWRDEPAHLIRATHTSEDGFDLFIGAQHAPSLWDALMAAGAQPVGLDALEILRIEAGLPRFGVDMDDTNVVTETGLDEAVSYTKGCYIGQEIIARIHWRGHVAKRISGLSFDGEVEARRGAAIKATDGKEIGRVTSATVSPRLKRTIALAYVKYDYLAPGTQVSVRLDEEERAARVSELPFVRGSWYESARATRDEQSV